MEQGEFDALPEKISGNDEISQLGESLIRLSKTLDSKFQHQIKMLKLSQKLNEGVFLNDILEYVYASFHTIIPYNRIGFTLLEKEGKILRAHWSSSDSPNVKLREGFSQPMKGSSLEQIVQSGNPRIINDLEQYYIEKPNSISTRLILAEGVRSSLTCPLISMGKSIGFIFFSSNEQNCYADIHQAVFCSIANQLSAVVEKSKLYEELYAVNKELKESRDAFKLQATHDALTGLWNRGTICEMLRKELARARRNEKGIALLMIDIDHFKRVNDTYGHQAGDEVLKEVARRFESIKRSEDSVGRYGGEEFIVVFTDMNATDMERVSDRYRHIIEDTPIKIPGNDLEITASLGLGLFLDAKKASEPTLIKLADTALYSAKNSGRNQLQVNIR
jgi:diguanylate cyclase (GGDEF)-like protein